MKIDYINDDHLDEILDAPLCNDVASLELFALAEEVKASRAEIASLKRQAATKDVKNIIPTKDVRCIQDIRWSMTSLAEAIDCVKSLDCGTDQKKNDYKLLARWLSTALGLGRAVYDVRVVLAQAEQGIENCGNKIRS